MFLFRILFPASVLFGVGLSQTIEIKVFELGDHSTGEAIEKSLGNTENLFGSSYFQAGVDALGFIEIGPISAVVHAFGDLLSNTDFWKTELANAITDELHRNKIETIIFFMETKIGQISSQLKYLKVKPEDVDHDRHDTGLIFQDKFDEMIDYFQNPASPFRDYPILAGPPLIHLALSVAIFQPIAKNLNLSSRFRI